MTNTKIEVLFICHDRIQLAGAVYSMVNMIESLKNDINPHILLRRGLVCNYLRKAGYHCVSFPFILNVFNSSLSHKKWYKKIRLISEAIINYICIVYVQQKLRNNKIDIIHTNSSASSIGYSLAKKLGAKHVWHIREFLNRDFGMEPTCGWSPYRHLIYNSDYVIAITKEVYFHWNLEICKKSAVIFNAVRSITDVEVKYIKQKYVLFCSATLSDNKGADFAVSLYCQSQIYKQGYRLLMIGDYTKEYIAKLNNIADSYNMAQYIKFLGYQSDVKPYLINASALLMCSICEAMGRVTVEALFFGCPIIAHNTGGTKEIIKNGINGLLYDNMDDAIQHLKNIITNPNLYVSMINNGIKTASQCFSTEHYREKMLEIYKEVVAS